LLEGRQEFPEQQRVAPGQRVAAPAELLRDITQPLPNQSADGGGPEWMQALLAGCRVVGQ
jgi:hypothetical protein